MRKPLMPLRHPGLYLRMTREKGKGLFCTADIAADETLEISPALVFNDADSAALGTTLLSDYAFSAAKLSRSAQAWAGIAQAADCRSLPMGMMVFCNHMMSPNALYDLIEEGGITYYRLYAIEDIPKDSEITLNYGPLWFASRKNR